MNAREARQLAATWLAHRPVCPRGFPVPWINRWGAETAARTRIGWDRHVGRRAVFFDDHGDVPDFTAQNMGRQREAMVRGLCQVCGRFTPWSRRNLVISGVTVQQVHLPELGVGAAAVIEPWLDDRCAAIATLLCPALIRRTHHDDLHVVPVRREKDVRLVVSVGRIEAGKLDAAGVHPDHAAQLAASVRQAPLAMWVKAVLLTKRIEFAGDVKAPADPAGASGESVVRGG